MALGGATRSSMVESRGSEHSLSDSLKETCSFPIISASPSSLVCPVTLTGWPCGLLAAGGLMGESAPEASDRVSFSMDFEGLGGRPKGCFGGRPRFLFTGVPAGGSWPWGSVPGGKALRGLPGLLFAAGGPLGGVAGTFLGLPRPLFVGTSGSTTAVGGCGEGSSC